jgi:hypothetical protein
LVERKDRLSGKKRQQRNLKSERLDNNEQKRGKWSEGLPGGDMHLA